MKITIFYDGSWYTFKWLKPLMWASGSFAKEGIKVEFYNAKEYLPKGDRLKTVQKAIESNKKFDVVFLAYHPTRALGAKKRNIELDIIKKLKNKSNKVVWLDTTDSTGTPQFEVLPYVDLYLKKQICSDLNEYCKKIWWGGRNYCQYFHEKYNAADDELERLQYVSVPFGLENKIKVSWNVGMADLWGNKYWSYALKTYKKDPGYLSVDMEREYDIHYRGTAATSVVGMQRSLCLEKLKGMKSSYSMPELEGKVPHDVYIKEISKSKCILSPFGYGEICTRDFEAFVYGAGLIKPDMSHMITYPTWYIDNETYISVDWDLENLEEKVETLFSGNQYLRIANQGQELYREEQSDLGKRRFLEHIMDILT